jgi:hypothetical protein
MAATVSKVNVGGAAPSAPMFHDRLDVVLDNSYPTGGYELNLQDVIGAGKQILSVQARGKVTATEAPDVRTYEYDAANDKLIGLTEARAEVANTTDLSTITVELYVTSN